MRLTHLLILIYVSAILIPVGAMIAYDQFVISEEPTEETTVETTEELRMGGNTSGVIVEYVERYPIIKPDEQGTGDNITGATIEYVEEPSKVVYKETPSYCQYVTTSSLSDKTNEITITEWELKDGSMVSTTTTYPINKVKQECF